MKEKVIKTVNKFDSYAIIWFMLATGECARQRELL